MAYEEIREIPGFKGYFVSTNGDVYSNKSGKMKKLKPFLDSRKKYLLIGLIDDSGQRRNLYWHHTKPRTDFCCQGVRQNQSRNVQDIFRNSAVFPERAWFTRFT